MIDRETIIAIATPPGRGGIGIIRVSGENALEIARRFFEPFPGDPEHARMYFGLFNGSIRDVGYCVWFRSPHSYTGEDTVEFHLHGSPYILKSCVSDILNSDLGRLAKPGEFTRRAFLNGKLNLLDVEAINTIISAENYFQARVLSEISEKLGDLVDSVRKNLLKALAFLEASIEYPEEEETRLAFDRALPFVRSSIEPIKKMLEIYEKKRFVYRGVKVVIAGEPNVGKSSLLNAIAGYERAIVTEIPGTTTDTLEVEVEHGGLNFTFVDTAGIREGRGKVEKLGIERSLGAIKEADLILYVFDNRTLKNGIPGDLKVYLKKIIPVLNKIDLEDIEEFDGIRLSARTGQGIDILLKKIFSEFESKNLGENLIFSERQYRVLSETLGILSNFLTSINSNLPEVLVSILIEAIEKIENLIGEVTTDDVLDTLFGGFCLGK